MDGRQNDPPIGARIRLLRDLLEGRYRKGELLAVPTITGKDELDCSSAVSLRAEFLPWVW